VSQAVTACQGYRFALDPTPAQQRGLVRHAGAARFAFNWGLALVKAALAQRAAERSYGVPDASLTPVPWSLDELRRRWNQAKGQVAPWWPECSKEAYNTGLGQLARALGNWSGAGRQALDAVQFEVDPEAGAGVFRGQRWNLRHAAWRVRRDLVGAALDQTEEPSGLGERGSAGLLHLRHGAGSPHGICDDQVGGERRLDDHDGQRIGEQVVELAGDPFAFRGGDALSLEFLLQASALGPGCQRARPFERLAHSHADRPRRHREGNHEHDVRGERGRIVQHEQRDRGEDSCERQRRA
jgi:hypothetical protein